jgi:hypothetical protein
MTKEPIAVKAGDDGGRGFPSSLSELGFDWAESIGAPQDEITGAFSGTYPEVNLSTILDEELVYGRSLKAENSDYSLRKVTILR